MVMTSFGEYISGHGGALSRRELKRLIDRWEWFTTARRARALLIGESDPALVLPSMFHPTIPPVIAPVPPPALEPSPSHPAGKDVIDRFIEHGGYRIVPSDEAPGVDVDVDIDPEMVTEELAAIYRSQGLVAEAEKIDMILKGK